MLDTNDTNTTIDPSVLSVTDKDKECMLTTYDNPYNPFTQFNLWLKYDLRLGHNCCGLLAKVASVDNIQSEFFNEKDVIDAINLICEEYPMIYKKVYRSDFKDLEKN